MIKDKLFSFNFCYILAANFLLFFAFYLLLPVLPFYLKEQFMAGKSMIGLFCLAIRWRVCVSGLFPGICSILSVGNLCICSLILSSPLFSEGIC